MRSPPGYLSEALVWIVVEPEVDRLGKLSRVVDMNVMSGASAVSMTGTFWSPTQRLT